MNIKSAENSPSVQTPAKLVNLVNRINFEKTEPNRNGLVGLKQTQHMQLSAPPDTFEQTLNENRMSLGNNGPDYDRQRYIPN